MRALTCWGMAALVLATPFLARSGTYQTFRRKATHIPQHNRVYYVATKLWGRKACTISSGGFQNSRGRYWIASAIKIASMVAAAQYLHRHHISTQESIYFRDRWGLYKGPLHQLFFMSNRDFDRLTRIGGPPSIDHLRTSLHYPYLTVRTAYATHSRYLRTSPTIYTRSFGVPGKTYTRFPKAPCRRNCSSLFELQDLMRRIVLHDHSLQLPKTATTQMRRYLRKKSPHSRRALRRVLPNKVIYSKSGSVPGHALIDNIMVRYGSSWLQISISVPHSQKHLIERVMGTLVTTLKAKQLCKNPARF
jgi:hypothetical protein